MADPLSSHKMVCEQCEMPMREAATNYDDNKCEDADKQQKEAVISLPFSLPLYK